MEREVKTQSEFDAAIAAGDVPVIGGDLCFTVNSGEPRITCVNGQPHVVAWGSSRPHVVAWGSSRPHVVARESSQPHVVARGSSQPHVEAWESSQPHVVAWESSQPHVVAKGHCQISARGKVRIIAAAMVAVLCWGDAPIVEGGGFVNRISISGARDWCDYYGVDTDGQSVLLYKALDQNFCANYNQFPYVPGTTPEAPDWDGGRVECGGGLHFSPSPIHALEFFPTATRFCACRLKLDEIVVHPGGTYPQKVKAPRCYEIFEVDRYGKRIGPEPIAATKPKAAVSKKAKRAPVKKGIKKTAKKARKP